MATTTRAPAGVATTATSRELASSTTTATSHGLTRSTTTTVTSHRSTRSTTTTATSHRLTHVSTSTATTATSYGSTYVPASTTATATSHRSSSHLHPTIIIFITILGGLIALCILAAILLPFFSCWRRRRISRAIGNARPTDNEKGLTNIRLSRERHISQVPLLKTDSRTSMDFSGKRPHYRLASETRPAQPADYVLDLYRQSTHSDVEDEGEILELKNPFIHHRPVPFTPSPPSSPLSRGFLVVQQENPFATVRGEPRLHVKEQNLVHVDAPAEQVQRQPDVVVSRSSTLSTASIYSQTSVPSPVQESVTPSLTSFPLPPTNAYRSMTVPQLGETRTDRTNVTF